MYHPILHRTALAPELGPLVYRADAITPYQTEALEELSSNGLVKADRFPDGRIEVRITDAGRESLRFGRRPRMASQASQRREASDDRQVSMTPPGGWLASRLPAVRSQDSQTKDTLA